MNRFGWLAALAAAFFFAERAEAVEALSTEELAEHCEIYLNEPDGEDGIFCVRYIQGFIDGAIATDERVTLNVADEFGSEEAESFTERAIRTRLGNRLQEFGSSYYAEFCLGEPVPLKEVVDLVVADVLDPLRTMNRPLARDVVYTTLRREYPCESPSD